MSGRRTHFTAELRILLCESCGAPVELPLGGGQVNCSYCQVVNVVHVRDERATLGLPAQPVPIDEGERLRRLRLQDGRPLLPPPSLAALIPGGRIEPWRLQEVVSVFQSTRKEVKITHSPEAAERLYFLTLVLSNHLGEANEQAKLRAVLETALETLELPRHRQTMRGMLARNAVREGDLAAAERWLAPSDTRSDDLEADSAYRLSRAFLDTARGDFGAVLALLGRSHDEVPIMDALDSGATVLRANALEKTGAIDAAVAVLKQHMGQGGRGGRDAIDAFVKLAPSLRLCEASIAKARGEHTEAAARSAGSGGKIFGMIFMVVGGGLMLLGAILGVVLGGGAVFLETAVGGAASAAALPGLMGGVLGGCAGPGIAGFIMAALGFVFYRSASSDAELMRIGVPAVGEVLSVATTSMRINHVPVLEVKLRIERPGQAPYEHTMRKPFHPGTINPGMRIPLKVHPQKPDQIVIEQG